jgi:hypothetical protein
MATESKSVQIQLNENEALVLFEWLARLDEREGEAAIDQAEQQVLWKLEGQLESNLNEVVSMDYLQRVAEAKNSILRE